MQNYRLGDYIRQRRQELNLTQEQVCAGICEPVQAFASLLLSPDLKMEGRPPVVQESMLFYNALACQMIGIMHL